jgi:hypothetical protein
MSLPSKWLFALALLSLGLGFNAHAQKSTVCTITVNSPDEKEIFRRNLPDDKFEFVELVERGRPDWLASACRQGVSCDVLVISGHFDAGTEFYSDKVDAREFLRSTKWSGCRAATRVRVVLATEGSLSFRLQHVECPNGRARPRRSYARLFAPGNRRPTRSAWQV